MFPGWMAAAIAVLAGAAPPAAPPVRLEAACDLTLPLRGGELLHFEASPEAAAGYLEVEQLGIDVVLEPAGRRVDAPTGRWGFETLIWQGERQLAVRTNDPLASPGRIRLVCAPLPAAPAERSFAESLAAAGLLPSDERGDVSAALAVYRQLAAAPGPPLGRLQSAFAAASLLQRKDPQAAAAMLAPALAAAEEKAEGMTSRPWLLAALLSRQGLLERDLGRLGEAEAAHLRALEIWQRLGRDPEVAAGRHNLGLLALQRGQPAAALELFRAALALLPPPREPAWRGELHGGAGGALDRLGQLRPAIEQYRLAFDLKFQVGDRRAQVGLLSNRALCHLALGEQQQALELLARAEQLVPAGEEALLGTLRNNLGFTYLGLGDADRAAATLEEALAFRRRGGDRRGQAISLNNLGRARRLLGQPAEARAAHQQALELADALGDQRQRGIGRLRLAELELSLGDAAAALAQLELAAAAAGESDPRLLAELLRTRARALLAAGRPAEASRLAERMLVVSRSSEDKLAQIEGDLLIGEIARREGRHPDALAAARRAVEEVATQRETLVSAEVRARFLAAQRDAFSLAIDSAVATGQPEIALAVAESSRQRTLLDVLGAAKPLQAVASLDGMKALLDRDTALLEFAIGPRQSHAFLLTTEGLETVPLPAETELDPLLREAGAEQSRLRPGDSATPAGERLSRLILAPFAARLAGKQRLVVVPDGRLAHLSFAALPLPPAFSAQPGDLAIDRFEVVYIPSLAVLAGQRRLAERPAGETAAGWLGAVADPVFTADDPRVGASAATGESAASRLGRLAASREEAAAILALAGERRSRGFFDFEAAKNLFVSGALAGFRFLHLATHGQVDASFAERTGLIFSTVDAAGKPRDGLLGLAEIYRLELGADLVVLSACESAVGGEIRGEGLISLSRAFLYAGVPRVAATLWRIPDGAASRLMPELYRGLWQDGLSVPAALRRAQLSLRRERRFRAGFNWAGFVYFGDWRPSAEKRSAAAETKAAAATVLR